MAILLLASCVDIPSSMLTFVSILDMSTLMPEVHTSSEFDLANETSGGMTEVFSGIDKVDESPRLVDVPT